MSAAFEVGMQGRARNVPAGEGAHFSAALDVAQAAQPISIAFVPTTREGQCRAKLECADRRQFEAQTITAWLVSNK